MDVMLEGKDDAKGSKAGSPELFADFEEYSSGLSFGALQCSAGPHPNAAAKRPKVLDNRRGFSGPGEPASD